MKNKIPDPQREEFRQQYRQGISVNQIAKKHGVVVSTVCRALDSMGVERTMRIKRKPENNPKSVYVIDMERQKEIVRLYESGRSRHSLSLEFGVAGGTVLNILKVHGANLRSKKESAARKLSADDERRIALLYEGGLDTHQIASMFGIAKSASWECLKRNGVTTRERGKFNFPFRNKTLEFKSEVKRLYIEGAPSGEIAKQLGTNSASVIGFLRMEGITIRPSSAEINRELARRGELGKVMSCRIQGISLEDFTGFIKGTWHLRNREKCIATHHRTRARLAGVRGAWTPEEWESLCVEYGHKCLKCGDTEASLTRDHIIPLGLPGSSNSIENIQPLCRACNSGKGNKTIDYRPDKSSIL